MNVRECIYHFSKSQRVLNIDDILDFDKLNTPWYLPSSQAGVSNTSTSIGHTAGFV